MPLLPNGLPRIAHWLDEYEALSPNGHGELRWLVVLARGGVRIVRQSKDRDGRWTWRRPRWNKVGRRGKIALAVDDGIWLFVGDPSEIAVASATMDVLGSLRPGDESYLTVAMAMGFEPGAQGTMLCRKVEGETVVGVEIHGTTANMNLPDLLALAGISEEDIAAVDGDRTTLVKRKAKTTVWRFAFENNLRPPLLVTSVQR